MPLKINDSNSIIEWKRKPTLLSPVNWTCGGARPRAAVVLGVALSFVFLPFTAERTRDASCGAFSFRFLLGALIVATAAGSWRSVFGCPPSSITRDLRFAARVFGTVAGASGDVAGSPIS